MTRSQKQTVKANSRRSAFRTMCTRSRTPCEDQAGVLFANWRISFYTQRSPHAREEEEEETPSRITHGILTHMQVMVPCVQKTSRSGFCTKWSWGAGIDCWLERRTRDRKIASSNPGRNGGRIVFSRVNLVCWLLFGVRSTPVLPQ